MSDISDSEHINDIIIDEPIYYILAQFLETKDGKNIATVIEELTDEVRKLRTVVSTSLKSATVDASSSTETN